VETQEYRISHSKGGTYVMDDKCPYCGAETRPGDNFCLNCGNRLLVATPSYQQATPLAGDATIPGSDQWSAPIGTPFAPAFNERATAGSTVHDEGTATQQATMENPARFTVRDDKGDVLQEYRLEKMETVIGRAPSSDILLSKDKLTSRRHAIVRYENGNYVISDERSANGTFVNGQQLEELVPHTLKDGDHIGIGEHELIFHLASGVEDIPTISVPQEVVAETIVRESPYHSAQEEKPMTAASSDDFSPRSLDGDGAVSVPAPQSVAVLPTAESVPATPAEAPAPRPNASAPSTPAVSFPSSETSGHADSSATFNRLTSLPTPTVPDITQLMAALATLDGQVSLLQEQLNNSQEAIRSHESDIAQTTNQLRSGVRRVSERMDSTIADVARQREQAGWADLLQLMEDVMNNPRDIEYVTKLARKARELNKVFQIHQIVLNTMAECNSLLRSLLGDERS
jgi:pSer/pThr/pTyr-binding forkhead associated (FHA) protein